ncbi:SAM-dependent methyltransferase [Streptomyces tsukubensis]|uniref:SAM-dependent methyltransferase n=1 Tax=Streptomyces tsukubensis TaxID=83656 RepID=UPI00344FCED4
MSPDDRPASPVHLDTSRAHSARIHDQLLGGVDHYQPDRDATAALQSVLSQAQQHVRTSRAYLQHTIRSLATEGIDQFADLGCGLPAFPHGDTHEAAQNINRAARVVYADTDPIVLAHARCRLEDNDNIRIADCDLRDTKRFREATSRFLDWDRPIVVLLSMVLDCLPDSGAVDPADVVRATAEHLSPGSAVFVSLLVTDDPAVRVAVTAIMADATGGQWGRMRDTEFVHRCVVGLETAPPGPADVTGLLPDTTPRRARGPRRRQQQHQPDGSAVWSALVRIPF